MLRETRWKLLVEAGLKMRLMCLMQLEGPIFGFSGINGKAEMFDAGDLAARFNLWPSRVGGVTLKVGSTYWVMFDLTLSTLRTISSSQLKQPEPHSYGAGWVFNERCSKNGAFPGNSRTGGLFGGLSI